MAAGITRPVGKRPVLRGRVGAGVRRAFAFFYPNIVGLDTRFAQFIADHLTTESVVLDAGCGNGRVFSYPWKDEVRFLVGCDLGNSVHQNPNLGAGVYADLAGLPFAAESFDVVFSRYVLEHVDGPDRTFTEFARVLKPGGKLLIITPNKHHYVTLISRLTPHWFHQKLGVFRGNRPEAAFPTRYLANTKSDLMHYAEQAGLCRGEFVAREGSPNYLSWFLPFFLLGVAYERLVNRFDFLKPFRVTIIASFERCQK